MQEVRCFVNEQHTVNLEQLKCGLGGCEPKTRKFLVLVQCIACLCAKQLHRGNLVASLFVGFARCCILGLRF